MPPPNKPPYKPPVVPARVSAESGMLASFLAMFGSTAQREAEKRAQDIRTYADTSAYVDSLRALVQRPKPGVMTGKRPLTIETQILHENPILGYVVSNLGIQDDGNININAADKAMTVRNEQARPMFGYATQSKAPEGKRLRNVLAHEFGHVDQGSPDSMYYDRHERRMTYGEMDEVITAASEPLAKKSKKPLGEVRADTFANAFQFLAAASQAADEAQYRRLLGEYEKNQPGTGQAVQAMINNPLFANHRYGYLYGPVKPGYERESTLKAWEEYDRRMKRRSR